MKKFEYRVDDNPRQELVNGHYELGDVKQIAVDGREIIYRLGNASLDNSCCGNFSCAYALVIGEKLGVGGDATLLRELSEAGGDEPLMSAIREALMASEAISLVNFYVEPPKKESRP
jgi:hypothetical protein